MTRTAVLIAASLLALAPPARAQRVSSVDGSKLLSLCTSKAAGFCNAYISGVADTAADMDAMAGQTGHSLGICIPKDVTGVELRQTVVASIKAHPEDNARSAVDLTLRALKAKYACGS